MRAMVIGSGAREHSLAWRLSRDSGVDEVLCAPGNGGSAAVGRNLDTGGDPDALVRAAIAEKVDFVVVGPEAPLVEGIVDDLEEAGIAAFGPGRFAARLEGSKVFSKEIMARHDIPTAGFRVFTDPETAIAYLREQGRPMVVKADGLAAGKGVIVAADVEEAVAGVELIMGEKKFGSAGDAIVVEELLPGEEVSYHVVSDGERYVALATAQDHKRAYDGDRGPNTGGMGAYSPPTVVDAAMERKVLERIVEPTLKGMAEEAQPYRGALFVGLMIVDGEPQVLEYNVRFGDPECETMMTRWQGDILPLLLGSAKGDLTGVEARWDAPCSLCVVLASGGYPGSYEKGKVITGVEEADRMEGVTVFHAGTRRDGDRLLTAGGRVLTVTAIGETLDQAAERAYGAADRIDFEGKQLRTDIGWRARSKS